MRRKCGLISSALQSNYFPDQERETLMISTLTCPSISLGDFVRRVTIDIEIALTKALTVWGKAITTKIELTDLRG